MPDSPSLPELSRRAAVKYAWKDISTRAKVLLGSALVVPLLLPSIAWWATYDFSESGFDAVTSGVFPYSVAVVAVILLLIVISAVLRAQWGHAKEVVAKHRQTIEAKQAEIDELRAQATLQPPTTIQITGGQNTFHIAPGVPIGSYQGGPQDAGEPAGGGDPDSPAVEEEPAGDTGDAGGHAG